ncbi:hypothetical protein [Bradyrhizobium yuanmingense]|uniref:hypothetical protein n=1 Tax=Bradyrhizobium yuanmingense TaxID=108015 RepID=UPI00187D3586|nr:hypothetical protein [Bradyrhizobium yuanmingense]
MQGAGGQYRLDHVGVDVAAPDLVLAGPLRRSSGRLLLVGIRRDQDRTLAGGRFVDLGHKRQRRALAAFARQPQLHRSERGAVRLLCGRDLADERPGLLLQRPVCLSKRSRVDAETVELGSRQHVQAFEFHRPDEGIELATNSHRGDERGAIAIGGKEPAAPVFRDCRRIGPSVEGEHQLGIMDRYCGVGGDLARCRPQKQVCAGRVAHGTVRGEFRLDLAARVLELQASGVSLRARGAGGRDRPANPGNRLAAAQQPRDRVGLLDVAAGRMNVDRTLQVLDGGEEAANAQRSLPIDLALDGDPAIAAGATRIGWSLGEIDRQPGGKSGFLGRRCFGTQSAGKQERGKEQDAGEHGRIGCAKEGLPGRYTMTGEVTTCSPMRHAD